MAVAGYALLMRGNGNNWETGHRQPCRCRTAQAIGIVAVNMLKLVSPQSVGARAWDQRKGGGRLPGEQVCRNEVTMIAALKRAGLRHAQLALQELRWPRHAAGLMGRAAESQYTEQYAQRAPMAPLNQTSLLNSTQPSFFPPQQAQQPPHSRWGASRRTVSR